MKNYAGAFRADFRLEDLDHALLAHYGREIMLANHMHDRALMPLVVMKWGMPAQTTVACDEWMGSSPIYHPRLRALLGISGSDVATILKGLQVDIGAPHGFLQFHYEVESAEKGYFWLTYCGAYMHVRRLTNASAKAEKQICHDMEDPTFDATVTAINPRARCRPIHRPPHHDIPREGPCRWQVSTDFEPIQVDPNPLTAIVRQSLAAQFRFADVKPRGDGLANYSGTFKRDFRFEDLDHNILAKLCREMQLDVHLLMKAAYTSIEKNWGLEHCLEFAHGEWAAMAPVYVHRLRRMFGIEGVDMSAILKVLQLDPYLPREFLDCGMALIDDHTGEFWINDCAALNDTGPRGVIDGLCDGNNSAIIYAVRAVNPKASVQSIAPSALTSRAPNARQAFRISIDDKAIGAVEKNPFTDLVAGADLWEFDNSIHRYFYADEAKRS